jgi:hypothetical protein
LINSVSVLEPSTQDFRQTRIDDSCESQVKIVLDPTELQKTFITVVQAIGGTGIAITRLAHTATIDDTANSIGDMKLIYSEEPVGSLGKNVRLMGMPHKADFLLEIVELGGDPAWCV